MKKETIVVWLHQEINDASEEIDELKLQVHPGKAELKVAFDKQIKSLEGRRNKLRDETHHLQYTSIAWGSLVEGCKGSWRELNDALQKTADDFRS